MKKIALILAVVLMLSFVLVACDNGTEESKATSDVVSTETSTETSTEASEEESTEVSDEEVSEDESTVIEPAAVGEVISVGKSYTRSELFRMGGADVNWGWDENAAHSYPDEDDVTLTDGVKDPGDASYTNAVWAGFNAQTPDYVENGYSWIIVDLGAKTDISLIELTAATSALENGIGASNFTVEFFVSDDGENWTSLGTEVAVDDPAVNFVDIAKATNTSGQFVKVHMVRGGWMFVSELAIYDVAAE